jgi:hypothetical protein
VRLVSRGVGRCGIRFRPGHSRYISLHPRCLQQGELGPLTAISKSTIFSAKVLISLLKQNLYSPGTVAVNTKSPFGTVQYNLLVGADDRVVDVEGAAGLDSKIKSNLRPLFPRIGEEARPLMSLQFIRQRRGIHSTRKASPEAGKEDEGPHRVASCRRRIDWGRFVDVQQFGDGHAMRCGKVQLSITNRHGRMMLHRYLGAAGMRPRRGWGTTHVPHVWVLPKSDKNRQLV